MDTIKLPSPTLQVNFSLILAELRNLCLQDALLATVETLNIRDIDKELAGSVPNQHLASLASKGLRGELVFPTPLILEANPSLLAYYRLLLGFSQKAFYTREYGACSFQTMERKGVIPKSCTSKIIHLCQAMISSAGQLIEGIGIPRLSRELLDDLTLLTLGPQMRGSANVDIGARGIIEVFSIIHTIVRGNTIAVSASKMTIRNAAGRTVLIEFASDPDIKIREEMPGQAYRNIIAVEIKAGTDFSNIHNRVGEAEKSHQKARQAGFVECWTVVNVGRLDIAMASRESPSTNRFYRLSMLKSADNEEFEDFRSRIIGLTGIPSGE